jgi:virginiamycin B lyase
VVSSRRRVADHPATRIVLMFLAGAQALAGAFVLGLAVNVGTSGVVTARPGAPVILTEVPVPPGPFPLAIEGPVPGWAGGSDIVAAPDGSVWSAAAAGTNGWAVTRLDRAGTTKSFPLPIVGAPRGLAAGPDNALWFLDGGPAPAVGRVSPQGVVTTLPVPSGRYLNGIASGPDGNLWITVDAPGPGDWIGRMTPSGALTRFPLPSTDGQPGPIVAGADGNLWFSMPNGLGRVTPAGEIIEVPMARTLGTPRIVAGPGGVVWFATNYYDGVSAVGRVTGGAHPRIDAQYSLPRQAELRDIVAAGDGNLWVAEQNPNAVARITPGGQITQYALTADKFPFRMAVTKDGTFWLTVGPARSGLYRFTMPPQ